MVDLPLAESREEAVAGALMVAREKRRAAEVLYEADCPAEALRVALQALEAARRVIEAAAGSEPDALRPPEIQSTLQAWGVLPEPAQRFVELGTEVLATTLPSTDARVEPRDLERLDELLRACRAVERAFDGVTRTRRQRAGWKIAGVVVPLALVALVALAAWLTLLELKPRVVAHGTWAERISELGPGFVVDRDPKSEWVAPDGTTGWIELRLRLRRDVRAVVLRNGNNRGLQDRGTRDYRIELYRKGKVLARAAGSFASIEANPLPVPVALQADDVDRVRVWVDSFHGYGACLAEIELQ